MNTRDDEALEFLVGQGCDPELAHWVIHDAHDVTDENREALARAGGWRPGAPPTSLALSTGYHDHHGGRCLCHECNLKAGRPTHEPDETPYTTTADGRRRWKRER